MNTDVMHQYTLALNDDEQRVLVEVLDELLKETRVEEHRTDAFKAKGLVKARQMTIESLLRKTRSAVPN